MRIDPTGGIILFNVRPFNTKFKLTFKSKATNISLH